MYLLSPPFHHVVTPCFSPCLSLFPTASHPFASSSILFHKPPALVSSLLISFHVSSYSLFVNFKAHTDSVFCRCGVFMASEKQSLSAQGGNINLKEGQLTTWLLHFTPKTDSFYALLYEGIHLQSHQGIYTDAKKTRGLL